MENGNSRIKGRWLPVIGLTFSTFIFNMSEFIPIGLLSDIAADFGTSESHAGLLITVYAWVVALASLPLMVMCSKTENKKLMTSIFALFVIGQFLSGISTGYYMLMMSRILVACSHAIFWSIVTPLAVKVAPEGKQSAALGLVVTGASVSMIIGLPAGRSIGIAMGWRATFLLISAISLVIMILLTAVLPKVPSENHVSLRNLPSLLGNPVLVGIYLLTAIFISGHFTAYSYVEPFLDQVVGMGGNAITMTLTVFGIVGIIGSILFSKYYDRHPDYFIRYAIAGTCIFLFLLHAASFSPAGIIAACVFWGLAITCFNLVFQAEIIRNAPHGTAVAMSLYSGIYNIGIGSGALIGGYVCSELSIKYIGYVGGAICAIGAIWCFKYLVPRLSGLRPDTVRPQRSRNADRPA